MKAEIKTLFSLDIETHLQDYKPEDTSNFGFWLRMIIGEKDKEGEESFDIFICTPKWLLANYSEEDIIYGYHHLIVFKYDFHEIKEKLETYVNDLSGSTWDDIANKISLIGKWEFLDYKE